MSVKTVPSGDSKIASHPWKIADGLPLKQDQPDLAGGLKPSEKFESQLG